MRHEVMKIVAIGDGTVGKTCVLIRYKDGTFPKKYIPTVVENYAKEIVIPGCTVNLALWDTSG